MEGRGTGSPSGERILDIIYSVIEELNRGIDEGSHLELSPETLLYGEKGQLDSLKLVELLVGTEERLEDELGVSLTLADERALARTSSPFRSVASLADYVGERLEGDPE
jgi:acyl carrier protein